MNVKNWVEKWIICTLETSLLSFFTVLESVAFSFTNLSYNVHHLNQNKSKFQKSSTKLNRV